MKISGLSALRKSFEPAVFLLTYTVWSHLGLNQGLPDYESGALTD